MPADPQRPTVLVVDDEPANIAMICETLGDRYRTRVATAGDKALQLAAAPERPELILLDIQMPGLDGYEVCRRLKDGPATAGIPVIFLTARTGIEDEARGFEAGAVDYIHKPFSPPIIRARVRTHLALRAAQRRSDELLEVVLPKPAAEELKRAGAVAPRRHERVAVLFCDLTGFTAYCDRHGPEEVVANLGLQVGRFEAVARAHGLEKIKTIGDAFMAAANLLGPHPDPLGASIDCGLAMAREAAGSGIGWSARVGVHIGPVVAGVVGAERYQYDIWGDTVNVAARLVARASPGTVTVVEGVWREVEDRFSGVSLDRQELKGKGSVVVHEVRGRR